MVVVYCGHNSKFTYLWKPISEVTTSFARIWSPFTFSHTLAKPRSPGFAIRARYFTVRFSFAAALFPSWCVCPDLRNCTPVRADLQSVRVTSPRGFHLLWDDPKPVSTFVPTLYQNTKHECFVTINKDRIEIRMSRAAGKTPTGPYKNKKRRSRHCFGVAPPPGVLPWDFGPSSEVHQEDGDPNRVGIYRPPNFRRRPFLTPPQLQQSRYYQKGP